MAVGDTGLTQGFGSSHLRPPGASTDRAPWRTEAPVRQRLGALRSGTSARPEQPHHSPLPWGKLGFVVARRSQHDGVLSSVWCLQNGCCQCRFSAQISNSYINSYPGGGFHAKSSTCAGRVPAFICRSAWHYTDSRKHVIPIGRKIPCFIYLSALRGKKFLGLSRTPLAMAILELSLVQDFQRQSLMTNSMKLPCLGESF